MCYTFKSLAVLAIAIAPCAFPQAGLIGQKSPDGQIRFQAIEELQIEGSHRVRLMPIATQHITPDEAKHFPQKELAQIGTLRTDSNHLLVRVDESGRPTDLVLPDSFAPKSPIEPAAAQGRLAIQTFQSKKAKTGDLIAPEQFFVFVAGPEPDRLALNLINRSAFFLGLDEQLAAMEGFVASFPDSPLKADFRSQLQERIAGSLAVFDNHGPYNGLLLTRRYVDLAHRAFPQDPALGQLSTQVVNLIRTVEASRIKLQSLAASGEWDLLLDAYPSFEHYQWSFPEMMALRQTALEESTRLHAHRGVLLAERQANTEALQELTSAQRRDPDNREIAEVLETTRVAASLAEANSAKPHALPPGSPAPELLLVQARLLAARGRHAEALPLLDTYDRTVSDPAARELGNTARNEILNDMEKKRTAFRQQLLQLQHEGDYTKLRATAAQALALDPEDDDFLFYSGATAALFRDAAAKERLDRYLTKSDSLRGDLLFRDRAYRIRALLNAPKSAPPAGTPNWLSGWPVADGIYYCPVSAAFQLPIDGIAGYKLKMAFQWDRNRLNAIVTTFDDEKGSLNYRSLGGGGDAQGNFFFAYLGTDPQVQVASTHRFDSTLNLTGFRVSHDASTPSHLAEENGQPRLLLRDSPQFDAAVLTALEGPLATGVAGNSFFNPFIWDGLHYFNLTYDSQGRLASAREWNADNLVRFTWSGDRLSEIQAFRKESPVPYYQRTISYSGAMIVGESYSLGSKTGQIKYVYSGKILQQVKVEDGGVHDGKTWTVRMH